MLEGGNQSLRDEAIRDFEFEHTFHLPGLRRGRTDSVSSRKRHCWSVLPCLAVTLYRGTLRIIYPESTYICLYIGIVRPPSRGCWKVEA